MTIGSDTRLLGEVCEVISGQSPPGSAYNAEGVGVPFYQGKKEFTDRFLGAPTTWTTSVTRKAEEGDVLMSVRAPVGPVNVATEQVCIGRGLAAIRAGDSVDRDFLYYSLKALQPSITGKSGAVFSSISKKQIAQLRIRVPPLDEQRRIVASLDQSLKQVEKLKRNRQAKLESLEDFKTVLLSKSLRSGARATASEEWPRIPLVELATRFVDGDWVETKDQAPKGVRLVQTGNVGRGIFHDRREKARYISTETFARLKCTEVLPGDCLISRLPDPVGRSCIVPELGEPMITAVDCTIVRFASERLLPQYFTYYSMSAGYQRAVDSLSTGATRRRISRTNLGSILVAVPPLEEQRRIVETLDQCFSAASAGASAVAEQLDLADSVSRSLLVEVLAAA